MPNPANPFDAVDRQLLAALQQDGRATVGELAEQVSLSASPCWRRIKHLEDAGVIEGYHARLSRQKLGYGVTGFVHLQMENHTPQAAESFERAVVALPQVLSCHNRRLPSLPARRSARCRACAKFQPVSRSRRSSVRWPCRCNKLDRDMPLGRYQSRRHNGRHDHHPAPTQKNQPPSA